MDSTSKRPTLRVVSLLPSATEKLALIGGLDMLVGRSHECDYPVEAAGVPILTSSRLTFESSKQIDTDVSKALSEGMGLYNLDTEKLLELRPDVILTQDICNVCSIDLAAVQRTAMKMDPRPTVVSLNPGGLEDVLSDVAVVGDAVGLGAQARKVQQQLRDRVASGIAAAEAAAERRRAQGKPPPKVAFLEWTEPAYVGGHWTPELIEMAGGLHPLNPAGSGTGGGAGKSFAVEPAQIVAADPDIVIWSPCGLDLDATEVEVSRLLDNDDSWFPPLRAVRDGRVCAVDGNQMFNRPGPRLVDAFEFLVWYVNLEPAGSATAPPPPPHLEGFPWRPWTMASRRPRVVRAAVERAEGEGESPLCAPKGGFAPDIEEAHRAAVRAGKDMYEDPATKYMVMTEEVHRRRGACCGRRCRHCPYGHWNVDAPNRANIVQTPVLCRVRPAGGEEGPVDVLFWSGGKDSYMSLLRLRQGGGGGRRVVLATTHGRDGVVGEQQIPVGRIMQQAKALGLDLMLIPLPDQCGSDEYVEVVGAAVARLLRDVGAEGHRGGCRMVFGDLHLKDIRAWREESMNGIGIPIEFPIFDVPYQELKELLFSGGGGVTITVSNVPEGPGTGVVKAGDVFDASLVAKLEQAGAIDPFGEKGEFHTEVCFPK